MSQSIISLLASVLALALVLALAWILIKALSILNKTNKRTGLVSVVDTVPIGNRERIILITYADKEYLIGATANNLTLLDEKEVHPHINEQNP